jgi:mono/diheme cytochrome c family protein
MRIGPWMLFVCALGCGGDKDADTGGDTAGDTTVDTAPPTSAERAATIVGLMATANIANGEDYYVAGALAPGCSECHQIDGTGTVDFPPLTERLPLLDDTQVAIVIHDGLPAPKPGGVPMPWYRDDLTDVQIAEVMAYINSKWDPTGLP